MNLTHEQVGLAHDAASRTCTVPFVMGALIEAGVSREHAAQGAAYIVANHDQEVDDG